MSAGRPGAPGGTTGTLSTGDDAFAPPYATASGARPLGFDQEKFTYRYAGRDFRFTDASGQVVQELIP